MPLRNELRKVGERIVAYFDGGGEPPFVIYQYLPDQEWSVRRDAGELRRWLEAEPRRVACSSVSWPGCSGKRSRAPDSSTS